VTPSDTNTRGHPLTAGRRRELRARASASSRRPPVLTCRRCWPAMSWTRTSSS